MLQTVGHPVCRLGARPEQFLDSLSSARIDLPLGKEYHLAEVASGTTSGRSGAIDLQFTKSHAHLVKNRLTSTGPLR